MGRLVTLPRRAARTRRPEPASRATHPFMSGLRARGNSSYTSEVPAGQKANPRMTPSDANASSSSPASLSPAERSSYVFLTIVTFVSLAADLITKGWAKGRLSGFDPQKLRPHEIEVIKDHLSFIYALNPGGAWSFLRGLPDSLRRPFFLFVSASAIVFIVSIYKRVPKGHNAMRWGLPLALGGAMGNLVDRIRYGSVIDFIDMYFTRGGREIHWPTYNVADIAIVAGVGLMVIDMLIPSRYAKLPELAAGLSSPIEVTALPSPSALPPADPTPPDVDTSAPPASEAAEPATLPAAGAALGLVGDTTTEPALTDDAVPPSKPLV